MRIAACPLPVCIGATCYFGRGSGIYKSEENGMDIQVGDIVTLKKQHPCGSKEWEVLRIGADFRLKCMGCGHQIMVTRKLVEKNMRDLKRNA